MNEFLPDRWIGFDIALVLCNLGLLEANTVREPEAWTNIASNQKTWKVADARLFYLFTAPISIAEQLGANGIDTAQAWIRNELVYPTLFPHGF